MKIIKRNSNRYPYKVVLDGGQKALVPNQRYFGNWLSTHGCSTIAERIALQFLGKVMSPEKLLKYNRTHFPEYLKNAKIPIKGIARSINKIMGKKCAVYHEFPSANQMRKWIRKGYVLIFETSNPIHTNVLVYGKEEKTVYNLTNGKVIKTTINKIVKRRCHTQPYKGCVVIKL